MEPPSVPGPSRSSSSSSDVMNVVPAMETETEAATNVALEQGGPVDEPAAPFVPLSEEEISGDAWAFLKDFFVLVEKRPDNFKTYQCVLCKPKVKSIKAHASTLSHLRLHVSRQHGTSLQKFEAAINQHSRRGKRPSGDDSKSPASKRQSSIATWASGAGSGALQSGVDRRIVDYFVGNMLALQVCQISKKKPRV